MCGPGPCSDAQSTQSDSRRSQAERAPALRCAISRHPPRLAPTSEVEPASPAGSIEQTCRGLRWVRGRYGDPVMSDDSVVIRWTLRGTVVVQHARTVPSKEERCLAGTQRYAVNVVVPALTLVDARSVLVGNLNAGRKSRIRWSEPQVVGIGSQIPGYDPVPSISKVVDYLLANVRVCLHGRQPGAVTREVEHALFRHDWRNRRSVRRALRARAATKSEHAHLRQPRAEAPVRERLLQRVELDVRGRHQQQRQEQAK